MEPRELEPIWRLEAARGAMASAVNGVAGAYGLSIAEAAMTLEAVQAALQRDLVTHLTIRHLEAVAPPDGGSESQQ